MLSILLFLKYTLEMVWYILITNIKDLRLLNTQCKCIFMTNLNAKIVNPCIYLPVVVVSPAPVSFPLSPVSFPLSPVSLHSPVFILAFFLCVDNGIKDFLCLFI
jgi:hypothetical protein